MNDLRGHRTPSFGRQLAQRVSWLHQNIGTPLVTAAQFLPVYGPMVAAAKPLYDMAGKGLKRLADGEDATPTLGDGFRAIKSARTLAEM